MQLRFMAKDAIPLLSRFRFTNNVTHLGNLQQHALLVPVNAIRGALIRVTMRVFICPVTSPPEFVGVLYSKSDKNVPAEFWPREHDTPRV